MSTLKVDTWKTSSGLENFPCTAWVNFNGTGTVVIRDSGNVSSITDTGVGSYTVNFTNAMANTNYAIFSMAVLQSNLAVINFVTKTTNSSNVECNITNGANADTSTADITVFGGR